MNPQKPYILMKFADSVYCVKIILQKKIRQNTYIKLYWLCIQSKIKRCQIMKTAKLFGSGLFQKIQILWGCPGQADVTMLAHQHIPLMACISMQFNQYILQCQCQPVKYCILTLLERRIIKQNISGSYHASTRIVT